MVCFWATFLEKNIGGVIALISLRLTWDGYSCRSEACYPSGQKHGRHSAVKRRDFITLIGGAAVMRPRASVRGCVRSSSRPGLRPFDVIDSFPAQAGRNS